MTSLNESKVATGTTQIAVPTCEHCLFGQYEPGSYEEGIHDYYDCNAPEELPEELYECETDEERAAKCGLFKPKMAATCACCHQVMDIPQYKVKHWAELTIMGDMEPCCSELCSTSLRARIYWLYRSEFFSGWRSRLYRIAAFFYWPEPTWHDFQAPWKVRLG